ncbi:hypothetical protein UNSW3_1079 [Campylobacter concisus UNSW3]|uniref:Uncharacterized protein n=2 Tax=Campylobacter concisus TaxID=199 RepID=U2G6J2_9BACT|nr:hypothetical protein UNSW3_1079 [Campylobacter concisus UNSW3]
MLKSLKNLKENAMQTNIDYAKYETMTRKALFNSLEKEEKKLNSLQDTLKKQSELILYLKKKIKSKLDEPKDYELLKSPSIKKLDIEFKKLSKVEQEALIAEVKTEMGV